MLALRIAVFLLTLSFGIEMASFVRYYLTSLDEELIASRPPIDHGCHPTANEVDKQCLKDQGGGLPSGSGTSAGNRPFDIRSEAVRTNGNVTAPLKVISKVKAEYTDLARTNGTQGTVTLRVTFLASGGIGAITVVRSLPDGLTENAIAAARKIRFEPQWRDGRTMTTTRPVSYAFNIY